LKPRTSGHQKKAKEMLQFDLENETETIRNYRERVRQCEELAEYAMSEQIREILIDEQDHQIALATALGRASHRSVRPHRNDDQFMSGRRA
jgi:bacterioferritin